MLFFDDLYCYISDRENQILNRKAYFYEII